MSDSDSTVSDDDSKDILNQTRSSLFELLRNRPGLTQSDQIPKFARLMHQQDLQTLGSAYIVASTRTLFIDALVQTRDKGLLKVFAEGKGVLIIKNWLIESLSNNWLEKQCKDIVGVLQKLPVSIDLLKTTKIATVVKQIQKKAIDTSTKMAVDQLLNSWQSQLETTSQKRSMTDVDKAQKKAKVEPKKAVSNMDFFKSLSLPKIQKSSGPKPQTETPMRPPPTVIEPSIEPEPTKSYRKSETASVPLKSSKKSVRWKPDAFLVEIRYFESDVHYEGEKKSAKEFDKAEGAEAIRRRKDEPHEQIMWKIPDPLNLPPLQPVITPETQAQDTREATVLGVFYRRLQDIPTTPDEPNEPFYEMPDDSSIPIIPLNDEAKVTPQISALSSLLSNLSNFIPGNQQPAPTYGLPAFAPAPVPAPMNLNFHYPPPPVNPPMNTTDRPRQVCRFWKQGSCRFGKKCRQEHS